MQFFWGGFSLHFLHQPFSTISSIILPSFCGNDHRFNLKVHFLVPSRNKSFCFINELSLACIN